MIAGRLNVRDFYSTCDHCGGVIKLAADDERDKEFESVINGFLKDIHSGKIKPGQVHADYYKAVSKRLADAVANGLGGNTFGAGDYRNTLKAFLDQNIYAFSGARSLYMLQQYNSFLTDADGKLLSEPQFISKVADITAIDNLSHLKTERNSAIASAQMAEKWQKMQAFETLEYRTVGDNRVRDEHKVLDRLTLRTDDQRWSTIYPPNGWNCRCTVVPGESTVTETTEATNKVKAADIQPYFKRNVGQERLVYSDDHPYIKNIGTGKLRELDAVKNYAMQSPEKIYDMQDLPKFTELPDEAAAETWWRNMAKGGSFDLKSVDGLQIAFDSDFKHHVLTQNTDDRYRIIMQLTDVLTNPDEVWANRIRGKLEMTYLKYYKEFPIVLGVEGDKSLRANTLYEAQRKGKLNYDAVKNLRKGVLKFKK